MSPIGPIAPTNTRLLTLTLPAHSSFVRIHQVKDGPVWFGPSPGSPPAYRFDAPAGQYRTLYAAEFLEGAFAETILRRARRIISRDYVELRQWSILSATRDLTLLKLFDEGLVFHGVTADICTGDDYTNAQRFGGELHGHYPEIDGIAYRARHNNGQICYALYDRVLPSQVDVVEARKFSDERAVTDELMRKHNASWDPMAPLPPPT
ncbi:RES family NAD+ phosphorylase [Rhizobium sp. VS19-DR104.2]|uniref:RES family NAD+ phosphorylase n=1 Tax=unclassified Rhizobium TaxID=2613769 RepID=UPI001CC377EA|nr:MULTISPECIES: RES family NAD+ phosphorylase [unclassified Rhizobium]MBZ5763038.1 RES family NAD+ phosphorylase [Rhizobium sp. VS19-DR96]MBZ5768817.1 RES family NAD+ phosphorylase [Rhizobium sp. VS19-DR129.2]MBZ5776346.1 RES family NAD+ phosphorylase [Rhizobium sp. VS19-DRK62.2]MBZ5787554.1 RES family NAD+ phosphorylase [Rhizobium sp. VS19-DR121]MBZ5804909.1 RES family NAD+ phosphorylase [Rhizobium sp. VS19-DR181]